MTPCAVENPFIRFNGTSGYSRHGETVSLFADRVDNLNSTGDPSGDLALQLWACQAPYGGGDLPGWKVAEFSLGALQPGGYLAPVKADVTGSFPESGDFAMTLVIAEWDGEGFNRIHDFHNYPCRDAFVHPRLEGTVGYRCVDDGHCVIEVERIHNPRDPDNMSGTLSLELWALAEPYAGGDFRGHALGATMPGCLAGGASWQQGTYDIATAMPPAGTYTLVLMLREWNGNGYVTRDHCSFSHRVTFPLAMSGTGTGETLAAPEARKPASAQVQTTGRVDAAIRDRPVETPAGGAGRARVLFEGLKRFALRAWEWLKRHW